MMTNFYTCGDCGNIMLEMGKPEELCRDGSLKLIEANSVDAAQEKHVPVVSYENGFVKIKIGSQPHPMLPEHYIEWVYVQTSFGGVFCHLDPGDPPEAAFHLKADEVQSVYAYCNIHGLWKAKEPVLPVDFDQNTVACSAEFTAGCVNPSK